MTNAMKFLKLSSMILNTNKISQVVIREKKYVILLDTRTEIFGVFMLGNGAIYSNCDNIVICVKKEPNDYKIVSDWINQL